MTTPVKKNIFNKQQSGQAPKNNVDIFKAASIFKNVKESSKPPQNLQKRPLEINSEKKSRTSQKPRPVKDLNIKIPESPKEKVNRRHSRSNSVLSPINQVERDQSMSRASKLSQNSDSDIQYNDQSYYQQSYKSQDASEQLKQEYRQKQTQHKTKQKSQKSQLTKDQLQYLQRIADQYQSKQLQIFYKNNRITNIQYMTIMEIKNQRLMQQKKEKFYERFTKYEEKVDELYQKFCNFIQKLKKQIDDKQQVIENLVILAKNQGIKKKDQNNQNISSQKFRKSQIIRLQYQVYKHSAYQLILKTISASLQAQLEQMDQRYTQNIHQIQELITQKPLNFNQINIFNKMKQFLSENQNFIKQKIFFLQAKSKNNSSSLDATAHSLYLQILEQNVLAEQMKIIQNKQIQEITQRGKKYFNKYDELTEQRIQLIENKVKKNTLKKVKLIREKMLSLIEWIKMIGYNGQLRIGQQYQQILVNITQDSQHRPQYLKIYGEEQVQNKLLEEFTFSRKGIYKKLWKKLEFAQYISDYLEEEQQRVDLQVKTEKKQRIIKQLESLEDFVKKIQSSSNLENNKGLSFIKKGQKSIFSINYNQQENKNAYINKIQQKKKNLNRLLQISKTLLKEKHQKSQTCLSPKQLLPSRDSKVLVLKDLNKIIDEEFFVNYHYQQISQEQIVQVMDALTIPICNKINKDHQIFEIPTFNELNTKKNLKRNFNSERQGSQLEKNYEQLLSINSNSKKIRQQKFGIQENEGQINQSNFNYQFQSYRKEEPQTSSYTKERYSPQQYQFNRFVTETLGTSLFQRGFNNKNRQNSIQQFEQEKYQNPSISQNPLFKTQSSQTSQLKQLSNFEIEQACQMFCRQFYANPSLSNTLTQKQFYFLMSPQYRSYFLQKRKNDEMLTKRIIQSIKNSNLINSLPNPYGPSPLNSNSNNKSPQIQNPLNHQIQIDPYFQHKIQQYQNKMFSENQYSDPFEPKLCYQLDKDDSSTLYQTDRQSHSYFGESHSGKKYSLLEQRLKQLQDLRMLNYFEQNMANKFRQNQNQIFEFRKQSQL